MALDMSQRCQGRSLCQQLGPEFHLRSRVKKPNVVVGVYNSSIGEIGGFQWASPGKLASSRPVRDHFRKIMPEI